VNPRACYETELLVEPAENKKKIAIVGAGPAGLSCAVTAAERGHEVHLFDGDSEIGGQFNMAKRIPGKEEFYETIRYYDVLIKKLGVNLHLDTYVDSERIKDGQYDEVVIATGVKPREIQMEGIDGLNVKGYIDVLKKEEAVGEEVVIIGAGGIGFDVTEYLNHNGSKLSMNTKKFMKAWGVDTDLKVRGGVAGISHPQSVPSKKITMLQRSKGKLGARLGKTTGWIHRTQMKKDNVKLIDNVSYEKIDKNGLHILRNNERRIIKADHIIICAGQVPNNSLYNELKGNVASIHLIGGAYKAAELDAKRAIKQGTELAARL